jgi:hypothetical protein
MFEEQQHLTDTANRGGCHQWRDAILGRTVGR